MHKTLLAGCLSLGFWVASQAGAQTANVQCQLTAVPPLVRAEGIAERMGDIRADCTGAPGALITGNLHVILNTNVTNRLGPGSTVDALLTFDNTGGGHMLTSTRALLVRSNEIVFEGLSIPVGASGTVQLQITNIRADASRTGTDFQNINAQLALNAGAILSFPVNRVVVGVPQPGLFSTSIAGFVASQQGSRLPEEEITFRSLLQAGSRRSTTRVTEGFQGAFTPRSSVEPQGTRILVRYSGLPSDARLFVPNLIAGSSALSMTSVGDFGRAVSGGEYVVGSGTLLLARVVSHDLNGAGGFAPSLETNSGTLTLNEVSEVQMVGGTGVAVYETLDAGRGIEFAEIPVFLGLPRSVEPRSITTTSDVFFAPQSTVAVASAQAPIPRYVARRPESDCRAIGDCNGEFIPRLVTRAELLDFVAVSGANFQIRYVTVDNAGRGVMQWNASITYKSGSDWLRIDPQSGTGGGSIRVDFIPIRLQPGFYEATLIIDAGPAGRSGYNITATVRALPPPPPPAPTISSIGNAASFMGNGVVRGSLATIRGTNLGGANLAVTFDGIPARVIYAAVDQLNVEVPAALAGRTNAALVVTAGGVTSASYNVPLAEVGPGIFVPGILNQDSTVNSERNPAATGSVIQIFTTGLLPPDGSATVEVRLHTEWFTTLAYVGPAPGIAGVQQVNVKIPEGWPTMTTDAQVCSTVRGLRACSPTVRISMRQAQ